MCDLVSPRVRRPGVLPAALTALGILAVLLVLGLLRTGLTSLNPSTAPALPGPGGVSDWLLAALGGPVVTVLGVFFTIWLIAPIVSGLRPIQVILRALLAALVGGVLLFLVSLLGLATATGGPDMLSALLSTLGVVVRIAPVVVLGGVLLWVWSRSRSASG